LIWVSADDRLRMAGLADGPPPAPPLLPPPPPNTFVLNIRRRATMTSPAAMATRPPVEENPL
jgi:hypothetical protein